jgi:hypothetical protein
LKFLFLYVASPSFEASYHLICLVATKQIKTLTITIIQVFGDSHPKLELFFAKGPSLCYNLINYLTILRKDDYQCPTFPPPCGLFCGACPLYQAEKDPGFNKKLAEKMKVAPERARCAGCRPCSGKVTPIPGGCSTFDCSLAKNVEFCYQRDQFPCHRLAPCADRAGILPHNFKLYSLLLLKKAGRKTREEEYPTLIRSYFRGKLKLGAGPELD